jgi:hypothetical protein
LVNISYRKVSSTSLILSLFQLVPLVKKSPALTALTYEMTTRRRLVCFIIRQDHHHHHHRSDSAISRVKNNLEKVEHQDLTEPDENIIGNKEKINETSVDGDYVGSGNMGGNPEVMKTKNKEAAEMADCATEM